MTACPILSDSGGRPVLLAVTLMLVMGSVLLAAGCVGQNPKEMGNKTPVATQHTTVITTITSLPAPIQEGVNSLQSFKKSIQELTDVGVDTSSSEEKYREAEQYVNSARSQPADQYDLAINDSRKAAGIIDEGKQILDKEWAENEVAIAQIPINNVDAVIAWYKGNQSTANDAQLPAIISEREVAVSYISMANDEISNGNYSQARIWAEIAYEKENESYTDALKSLKPQRLV